MLEPGRGWSLLVQPARQDRPEVERVTSRWPPRGGTRGLVISTSLTPTVREPPWENRSQRAGVGICLWGIQLSILQVAGWRSVRGRVGTRENEGEQIYLAKDLVKDSYWKQILVRAIREACIQGFQLSEVWGLRSSLDELGEGSVKDAAFERQPWGVNRVTGTSASSHSERSSSPLTGREEGSVGLQASPHPSLPSLLFGPRIPVPLLFWEHSAGKHFPFRMCLPGRGHRAGPASLH